MLFDGWSGIVRVAVAALVGGAALAAILRISGKRTLAKMSAFDLVVTVALGSTLATLVLSREVPIIEGVLAFLMLLGSNGSWPGPLRVGVLSSASSNRNHGCYSSAARCLSRPCGRSGLCPTRLRLPFGQAGSAESMKSRQSCWKLLTQRPTARRSAFPISFMAAAYERNPTVTTVRGLLRRFIAGLMNFSAARSSGTGPAVSARGAKRHPSLHTFGRNILRWQRSSVRF